jgi:head-tail adaptor
MAEIARRIGPLRERVHFQARAMADDGLGMTLPSGEYETRFTVWASYLPLRGSESVQASRLQGRQPYVISVRQSSQTREANEAWRLVDARDPRRIFAIVAPATDPDGSRAWLDFLVVQGAPS